MPQARPHPVVRHQQSGTNGEAHKAQRHARRNPTAIPPHDRHRHGHRQPQGSHHGQPMTRFIDEAPDEGDQREVAPNHHARHPPGRLGADIKPLLGDLRQVLREGEQRRRLEHVIHDDAPERPRQLGDAPRLEAARPLDQPLARRRVGQHAVLAAACAHKEQAGDAQQQHAEVGERGDPERPGQVAGALGDDVGQRFGHQHAQLRRRQLQPERQREAVVWREPRREEAVARGAVGRVAQRQRAGAQQHQAIGAGLHGGADDDGADDADGAGDDEGGWGEGLLVF